MGVFRCKVFVIGETENIDKSQFDVFKGKKLCVDHGILFNKI